MCVVVDANQASQVFRPDPAPEYAPVLEWVRTRGLLVLGGRLSDELARLTDVRRVLAALERAGRVHVAARAAIDEDEGALAALGLLQSDDPHVVALVRIAKVRTVVTEDQALVRDLHDRTLVPRPKVAIYKGIGRPPNLRTLRHSPGCPGGKHWK